MKDFDNWNEIKKKINQRKRIDVKKGSVWLCNLGLNIGYEIDGKNKDYIRPVLVILGFKRGGGIVLPLTTTDKKSRFIIYIKGNSKVNITQIRYLDSKSFYRRVDSVDRKVFDKVIRDFKSLF